MKAINAGRCMINNFGTNTWTLIAAVYQLLIFFGLKDTINPYMDMGYEYVCTCVIDANGIKSMLGAGE